MTLQRRGRAERFSAATHRRSGRRKPASRHSRRSREAGHRSLIPPGLVVLGDPGHTVLASQTRCTRLGAPASSSSPCASRPVPTVDPARYDE
jgi:hypothetical protein